MQYARKNQDGQVIDQPATRPRVTQQTSRCVGELVGMHNRFLGEYTRGPRRGASVSALSQARPQERRTRAKCKWDPVGKVTEAIDLTVPDETERNSE